MEISSCDKGHYPGVKNWRFGGDDESVESNAAAEEEEEGEDEDRVMFAESSFPVVQSNSVLA